MTYTDYSLTTIVQKGKQAGHIVVNQDIYHPNYIPGSQYDDNVGYIAFEYTDHSGHHFERLTPDMTFRESEPIIAATLARIQGRKVTLSEVKRSIETTA